MKKVFEIEMPDSYEMTAEDLLGAINGDCGYTTEGKIFVEDITLGYLALAKSFVSLQDTYESVVAQLADVTDVAELIPHSDREDKETILHCWGCNITTGVSHNCNCDEVKGLGKPAPEIDRIKDRLPKWVADPNALAESIWSPLVDLGRHRIGKILVIGRDIWKLITSGDPMLNMLDPTTKVEEYLKGHVGVIFGLELYTDGWLPDGERFLEGMEFCLCNSLEEFYKIAPPLTKEGWNALEAELKFKNEEE